MMRITLEVAMTSEGGMKKVYIIRSTTAIIDGSTIESGWCEGKIMVW